MLIRNLRTHIQRNGWRGTASGIAWKLNPTIFEIWERELVSGPVSAPVPARVALRSGHDAITDLKHLRQGVSGLASEFYRDVADSTGTCLLALIDGHLAGIAWIYDLKSPGHFLRMSSADVELRSIYTCPEFRGLGVAKALIGEACVSLKSQGFRRMFAVIHQSNRPSQRAFQASGFLKIAELSRPAIFGPRFITASGECEDWPSRLASLVVRGTT